MPDPSLGYLLLRGLPPPAQKLNRNEHMFKVSICWQDWTLNGIVYKRYLEEFGKQEVQADIIELEPLLPEVQPEGGADPAGGDEPGVCEANAAV
jgi:hypothetical protein